MKRDHVKTQGRPKIQDEFTDLPVSRQRKSQLRRKRDGLCIICGQPQCSSRFCLKHLLATRERQRKNVGSIKRNRSKSYQLEASAKASLKLQAKALKRK